MESGLWLRAGLVGRPHGLDGSFHVVQATPQLLVAGMSVVMGSETRRITRRAGLDSQPIIAVEGCTDRPAAQALQGQELLVARDQAPSLGEEEWWAEELEGCSVRDGRRPVGTVSRLIGLPSVDVLEVTRPGGAGDLMVPLLREAVRSVDIQRRDIDVDLRFLGEE